MQPSAILERLHGLGVAVAVNEDKGTLCLEPGSLVPPALLAELRRHKAEVLALLTLPEPVEAANEVDRLVRLGQALRQGKVMAVRCGLDGHRCTVCEGIPCWGSNAWSEGNA
jgi:hypothetical protein